MLWTRSSNISSTTDRERAEGDGGHRLGLTRRPGPGREIGHLDDPIRVTGPSIYPKKLSRACASLGVDDQIPFQFNELNLEPGLGRGEPVYTSFTPLFSTAHFGGAEGDKSMKPFQMPSLFSRGTIAAALLIAAPGVAQAATVFDQGPVQPSGGVRSVFWNADDFTLSTSSLLRGATFNLGYDVRPGFAPAPNINYELYTDNAGTPGTIFQSGTSTTSVTDLGLNNDSTYRFNAWAFDFASPVLALAGVRYWIGVQQPADVAIAHTRGTNPGASAMIRLGTYVPRDAGLAFSLQGTAVEAPGPVPEPASWTMMILGFGAVGGAMRRRARICVRIA